MGEPLSLGKVRALTETEKALRVVLHDDDNKMIWVPKGVIHDDSEVWKWMQEGELVIDSSSWWARTGGYV